MQEEKVLKIATVVLPVKDDKVWLGMKTRNIGKDCWNGFGGGVENRETVPVCAIRELKEESSLRAKQKDLEKVAIIDFYNEKVDGSVYVSRVHFFIVRKWYRLHFFFTKDFFGSPKETRDKGMITPTLFDCDDLPKKMMPADREFFPLILNGKKIIGRAYYTPFQKELKREVEIKEVDELPED